MDYNEIIKLLDAGFSREEIMEMKAQPPADPEPTPEEQFLQDARRKIIHQAMDRLQPEMRMAVHLTYFEELSADEAARVLRKSRKQVYNLLYRAKQLLRTALEEEELL